MHVVAGPHDPFFYRPVDGRVHVSGFNTKQHLAGKRGLITGTAFAFPVFKSGNARRALEPKKRGQLPLRKAPHAPMGAQVAERLTVFHVNSRFTEG